MLRKKIQIFQAKLISYLRRLEPRRGLRAITALFACVSLILASAWVLRVVETRVREPSQASGPGQNSKTQSWGPSLEHKVRLALLVTFSDTNIFREDAVTSS